MSALALASIVVLASLVVLGAVAASGLGPLRSLRRTMDRFAEVEAETERLRRGVDILAQRRDRLGGRTVD
ncbi:MAG TPA: hypothetical protein VM840_08725 [Actinomycetota bacterium]|nr:hypothetical protein [Actinomycetota bacterium]